MKISKIGLKQLIATNDLDKVIEEMFALFTLYIGKFGEKGISEFYDRLILLSGKFNGLNQELSLGIIDSDSANVEKSRLIHAVLSLINDLPDHVFSQKEVKAEVKEKAVDLRSQVTKKLGQNEFEFDVFLSFANEDKAMAEKVYEALRGYGLKVFLSSESLRLNTGQSFFEKIQQALLNSKHFVLLCTPNAMSSEWVKSEYETFYNEFYMKQKKERKLLIFKGEGFSMQNVPLLLRRLQMAEKVQHVIEALIEAKAKEKPSAKKKDDVATATKGASTTKAAKPKPVPAKKSEEVNFFTQLKKHLKQSVHLDGFFCDPIPARKEQGARKTCVIPPEVEIFALVDATVFGSAEECLVFTTKGIHFHNAWSGKLPGAFFIDYKDLKNRKVAKDGWHELTIGDGGSFDMSGSSVTRDDLLKILEGVQGLL